MTQTTKPTTKPDQTIDPLSFIYLPTTAARVARDEVVRRANNTSPLITNIPEIDARLNPAMPGEVVTVLARAKQGKTTFLVALAKMWASSLRERPVSGKPPLIVYATWETLVEEFVTSFIAEDSGQNMAEISRGNLDLARYDHALVQSLGKNFAVFGRSSQKRSAFAASSSPTLFDLHRAILHLQQEYDVQAVLIDYLQKIPDNDRLLHNDRMTAVVSDNMGRVCEIALSLSVPIWLAAQAGREVDDKTTGLKFPEMKHAQWTSRVEQDSSKVLGVARISTDDRLPIGEEFDVKGRPPASNRKVKPIDTYEVDENTFGIKLLAQRGGYCDTFDNWFVQMDWANATFKLQQPVARRYEEAKESVAY